MPLASVILRPLIWPWIRTDEVVEGEALPPVAGMLRPLPDQYWATSGATLPLKALALKAGALASAEASTLRVRAPFAPEPIELLEPLPFEEEPVVAAGVWVVLAEEPLVVAAGVCVVLAVEPLLFELLLEEELLLMPLTLKACQGTRT